MTEHKSDLVKLHRQQVLPARDEMEAALERYYEGPVESVIKLRDDR